MTAIENRSGVAAENINHGIKRGRRP